ncbi:hypothetical protein [Streptomyces sp. G-5]|uniref:hypothetical protein n=1 Tax=Streptomyces sp. G-5 TaxID=2977231 RepID=UPI0021D080C1|nr:hypothetical protein [Streptomyces sp. G-5]MCU4747158.1 hypothetical protein [Streptomyces sp. G-5]
MTTPTVDAYETRTPDSEGWLGVPFRHPRGLNPALPVPAAEYEAGTHDGGPHDLVPQQRW